jgi:hypothetical protein
MYYMYVLLCFRLMDERFEESRIVTVASVKLKGSSAGVGEM